MRGRKRGASRWARPAIMLGAAVMLLAAACGGGTEAKGGKVFDSVGKGEGKLSLIAWPGYVESGENDPKVDWVTPFQDQSGCQVSVKYANTSDEMVALMRQGGGKIYDGVSASGDATNRLIAHGDVAGVDVQKLIDAYKNQEIMPALQSPGHNTVDGVHYGVPYMWGVNFLMYNTEKVQKPSSWDITFEPSSPYAGNITAYDSPIYIADAALYLKAHQPDLGITDPYELTQAQFDASVDLLKQQAGMVRKYWAVYTDEIDAFKTGDLVAGTAWPVNLSLLLADGQPVDAVIPSEGVTGWADTWMMSSNAPHPNCMLQWMQWTTKADIQAQVAEYYGATPSNSASCDQLRTDLGEEADTVYHCGDQDFLKAIALWKTPQADCGNGRNDCMDYSKWTEAWTAIRGA